MINAVAQLQRILPEIGCRGDEVSDSQLTKAVIRIFAAVE
jgi:hypothetical protein